jgi:starch synthase
MSSEIRILGVDMEGLTDFRKQTTRNSGLYRALDERMRVAHTLTPRLPLAQERLIQLLHIAPGPELWRRRAGLAPMYFRALTHVVEKELTSRQGSFDVVLQFYCLFAPGRLDAGRRYALYLDATAELTRRHFPGDSPIGPLARRRRLALERATYHGAARLFPMSEWVRASLIEDYGVDDARIVVAGAGANGLLPVLPERRWDQRVVLFIGMRWKRKGGPELLEAWRAVHRAVPDAELWIVGARRNHDRDVPGVRWFGTMPFERVAELYLQASVFALPSRFDPFPHVLREAMGRGLPCVATRTGGTPEIIRDGVDGVLIDPDDGDALVAALVGLLELPDRAEAMGRAGHARMRDEATWTRVADVISPHIEAMANE